MTSTTPEKRGRGRPAGSRASDRHDTVRARCTPAQRETWERLGGAKWLRQQLDLLRPAS